MMLGLNFNIFKSSTVWGALIAALGFISSPSVLAILPEKWGAIVLAIGGFLTAIGARNAIAGNGPATAKADKANGLT